MPNTGVLMDKISGNNTIARFCDKKSISASGRVSGTAFKLRPRDKGNLSTNWVEYIESTMHKNALKHLQDFYNKIMTDTSNAKIGYLNVKKTINYVKRESKDNRKLDIYHNGKLSRSNPSHSIITGTELDEMEIFDLLAETLIATHNF